MSERLSWSEAEAVVRAYRAEHGMSSDVDVETLAQTLGTSPAEVRRLAGRKRRFTDRSGVLSALLTLGVVIFAGVAFGPSLATRGNVARQSGHVHPMPALRTTKIVIVADSSGRVRLLDDNGQPSPIDPSIYRTFDPATLGVPEEKTL